jgi:hypothetical protein
VKDKAETGAESITVIPTNGAPTRSTVWACDPTLQSFSNFVTHPFELHEKTKG